MKIKLAILALSLGLTRQFCMAQPAASAALDDFKPASSNVPGQQYPRINSELRAMFRVNAPGATNVSVSLGRPLQVVRGGDGVWTITTPPLAPGFHYYSLIIDGVSVADPASESYFGTGKMSSGLEVPSKGEDFYEPKNVPHGEVRARWYFSKTTGATRTSIRRQTTTPSAAPGIRCSTSSTAWGRTCAAGPPRDARISSLTT
jgi:hypothetical protein